MKKNYFLAALFAFALTSVSAQFTDDMESYTPGQTVYENWWVDWCGGTCPGLASDTYAQSDQVWIQFLILEIRSSELGIIPLISTYQQDQQGT